MKKILLFVLLGITTLLQAQSVKVTYDILEPGTFTYDADYPKSWTTTHLVIKGDINADDIYVMCTEFWKLDTLDLSQANIKAYNGTVGGQTVDLIDNEFPPYCLSSATNLKYVILPPTLQIMDDYIFGENNIEFYITPSNQYFTIENNIIYNKNKTEIHFVDRTITGTFTVPSTVTTIGYSSFLGTQFDKVILPEGVTKIKQNAFMSSAITSINLPSTVITIESDAFNNAHLTDLVIPKSVTYIGISCFIGIDTLKSIYFEGYPLTIKDGAFQYLTGIENVYVNEVYPPSAKSGMFYEGNQSNCNLFVPFGTATLYKTANVWKDFKIIKEMLPISNESQSIKIKPSQTENWTVSTSSPWITFSATSGTSSDSLTITFTANTTLDQRDAIISITTSSVNDVAVFQKAGKAINPTSIASINKNNLIIYPNPASSFITVKSEIVTPIQIFDKQGRILLIKEVSGETEINISELQSGVYFIKSVDNVQTFIKK